MKTSKTTEEAIRQMEKRYRRLETAIIAEAAEYIKQAEQVTEEADWLIGRMYASGAKMDKIQAVIQAESGLSKQKVRKIFEKAAQDASLTNADLYTAAGKTPIPAADNLQLQQLTRAIAAQTENMFDNLTGTAGFMIRDANTGKMKALPIRSLFTDYLDECALKVVHGFLSPNDAMRDAVNALTASGLRTIDYASGRSDRIDTAVRRAIMTGTNQITAAVQEEDAAYLGTDYFEVEWHEGARPTHQVWQGKVYTKEQLRTVCGLGTVTGLCGANCYHTYYPFVEGISKRLYTDKWLDRQNKKENTPRTYSPTGKQYTLYEAKQQQRRLELELRVKEERVEALTKAGASQPVIQAAKIRYTATANTYEHFCYEMKLPEEWERTEIRKPRKKGQAKKAP